MLERKRHRERERGRVSGWVWGGGWEEMSVGATQNSKTNKEL